MKNLKYILLIGTGLTFSSCEKSFLEKNPTGQVGKDQLLTTIQGLQNALTGSYTLISAYHVQEYGMYGDLRGDDVTLNKTASSVVMLPEYDYTSQAESSLLAVGNIWADILAALNNVNNVINAAEEMGAATTTNQNLKSVYGQALVLRAMCTFDLSQIYAQHYTYTADASHLGVPVLLKTPIPGTSVARRSIKDSYAQILQDLTSGIEYLKDQDLSKLRASAHAAQALRSRIYLYMNDWENVVNDASTIITTQKYSMVSASDYQRLFMDPNQRNGLIASEVIWQLNRYSYGRTDINVIFSDENELQVTAKKSYVDLFENSDVRKSMFGTNSKGEVYTLKYALSTATSSSVWPVNFKVFRSVELYLNRAEANYHLGKYDAAVEDLKIVRGRAYNTNPNNIVVNYATPSELLEFILLERRKELGFENQRIFDIVRNKKDLNRGADCNSVVCSLTYPNNKFVLPIPLLELDANPAMQPNPEVNN